MPLHQIGESASWYSKDQLDTRVPGFKELFSTVRPQVPQHATISISTQELDCLQSYSIVCTVLYYIGIIATTQLNSTQSWVSLIFLCKTTTTNHKPQNHKPYPTLSQLLHNQSRPNSVYNLISTQLEDSCKKRGHIPPPKKSSSTKFSLPPYFNLN